MKKLFTTFKTLLLGGLLFSSTLVEAQTIAGATGSYPLNTDRLYANGISPGATDKYKAAISSYNSWKQTYTATDCNGQARVIFDFYPGGLGATDRSETVSEGIAYGMLLSAYAGDRSLFDGLWAFYKSHRNGNGVMNWKIRNCNTVTGANGATDAELDVAMALIVASYQWQNDNYLGDAKNMIRIIREKEFDGAILKPGDQFGGFNLTNPSYFSPAYYEVFKQYDGNATFWNNAIAKGYEIIGKADKNNNGLVPDWTDGNGNTTSAASQYKDGGKNFFFDAVRTPFRSAIDYLWHGRTAGKDYCNKLITWSSNAHGGGTEQLQSNYTINGTSLGGGHSNTFVGCFSIAAMTTNNQSYLNRGYADNQSTVPGNGQYFNATFKVIANFVMSGNFYLPPLGNCSGPDLGTDKSLCSSNSVQLNAGVTGATYEWRKDGNKINGATSATYTATTAGVYEVVTDQAGCVRRDNVTVFGSTIEAGFVAVAGPGNLTVTSSTIGGIKGTGNSGYTYTVTPPTGAPLTKTTPDFELNSIENGQYTIKLDVTNVGYGCAGTSTLTKLVTVGDGVGVAIDDFDKGNQEGNYPYISATKIKPIVKTWCSKTDYEKNKAKDCPVFSCGNWELDFNGAAVAPVSDQYNPVGIDFSGNADAPFDLTGVPFVAIRAYATKPIDMYVKLNQKTSLIDFSNNSSTKNKISLTTEPQVFNIDFSTLLSGWDNEAKKSLTIAAWNHVTGLSIFPFDNGSKLINADYDGIVTIDYVIVGAKGIPSPTFNIKKDELGFTDYGVYLKDYYPNDPLYKDCTTDTEGPACYGSVPDWQREIIACGNTATVKANACTANEIRWYKGTSLVATGDEATLTPGDYTIQLIGVGGVTKDVVKIIGSNTVADFVVDRTNYSATFINKSTGYQTKVWNYGDAANDEPESTTWDIGYHNYQTAGAGTYTVTLTVTDTVCNVTKVATQKVVVACDELTGPITVIDSTIKGCAGDVVTFEINPVDNAEAYGWFAPEGSKIVGDSLSVTVTFGAVDGPLTIEAYNACSAAPVSNKSVKSIELNLAGKPVGTFVLDPNVSGGFTLEAGADAPANDGETYAWTFGDGNTGTGATVEHTYAASLLNIPQTVCLTVKNRCATSEKECKEFTPTEPVGFFTLNEQNVSMFPTAATNSLTVELSGRANVTISDVLGNTVSQSVITDRGTINVSDLNAGMYIMSIKQGSEVVNKRFIKE